MSRTHNASAPAHIINNNNKRPFQHMQSTHSAPGTFVDSSSDWTGTPNMCHQRASAAPAPIVAAYAPDDFISKMNSRSSSSNIDYETSSTSAKRQRVEGHGGLTNHSPFSHGVSYSYNVVSPCTNISNMSSSLSSSSLSPTDASSEVMSRQSSSATDLSLNDGVDMCRIGSDFSSFSGNMPFPLDVADASFLPSSAVGAPSNSLTATGYDADAALQLLGGMGQDFGVGSQDFPCSDILPFHDGAYGAVGGPQPWTSGQQVSCQEMQRSYSDQSAASSSSSLADLKANERRRKHLENGKRNIASRSIPNGPLSTKSAETKPQIRLLKPQEPGQQRKELISKTTYTRPQHSKLKCDRCNEFPDGFRGDHELRRHQDRAHATIRKVWICVDPGESNGTTDDLRPQRPVGICKQCINHKEYNVYYNAAAHLRRAHFRPRKRGRKARGEERESRAGKAGGDWPPIDWLKQHGWLKEIEVGGKSSAATEDNGDDIAAVPPLTDSQDGDEEDSLDDFDTADLPPSYESVMQDDYSASLFNLSAYPPLTDLDFDGTLDYPTQMGLDANTLYPSCDPAFLQAPAMQHSMSAPGMLDGSTSFFNNPSFY